MTKSFAVLVSAPEEMMRLMCGNQEIAPLEDGG
jgi:hypothetical protein